MNKNTTNNDPVNHPQHYTSHPSGIECITVTRHMSFNLGNAIKYIWRANDKGNTKQDLEKAVWYIQDEIKRIVANRGEVSIAIHEEKQEEISNVLQQPIEVPSKYYTKR